MSSSSRSIAAARQKRAGEQVQKMNNTSRPVTSISSQSAFAQQFQNQQQLLNAASSVGNRNVRPIQQNQSMPPPIPSQIPVQIPQDQPTKITVSDAVGLITLRLSRLENIINDVVEGNVLKNNNENNSIIPSNMKLVSDEVFENIVNRINLLESKVISFNNQLENITKDMSDIRNVVVNNNSTIHNFMNETNDKFVLYENALSELESSLEIAVPQDKNNENTDECDDVNENMEEVVSANVNETMKEDVNENISIATTEIVEEVN
jgi:hypothetical protein